MFLSCLFKLKTLQLLSLCFLLLAELLLALLRLLAYLLLLCISVILTSVSALGRSYGFILLVVLIKVYITAPCVNVLCDLLASLYSLTLDVLCGRCVCLDICKVDNRLCRSCLLCRLCIPAVISGIVSSVAVGLSVTLLSVAIGLSVTLLSVAVRLSVALLFVAVGLSVTLLSVAVGLSVALLFVTVRLSVPAVCRRKAFCRYGRP